MFKNKLATIFLTIITFFLFTYPSTFSVDFVEDENVHISNIHTIEDDLFIWGNNVTIDGEVTGDIFGGGYQVVTNGEILSSANIFAYDYTHNGDIDGSLRVFAYSSDIDGMVGRSLMAFGNTVKVGKEAVIQKEVYISGGVVNFDGTVNENASINGGSVYVTGTIEGNLTINAEKINILPPALIKGDFKYVSNNEANIDTESGVNILGNLTWDLPKDDEVDNSSSFTTMVLTCSKFFAAFLFGILIMIIGKKQIHEMIHQLQNRFAVSISVGVLSSVIFILSIAVLVTSLVVLMIGLALVSDGETLGGGILFLLSTLLVPISSFAMVSGGVLLYSGKIIVALLLGYLIVLKIKSNPKYLSKTQLLIGLIILYLLFSIPYLGILILILITITGAGAMVLGIKHCNDGKSNSGVENQLGK